MEFLRQNILLIAVAVVSGAMLIWPYFRRASGGPWASAAEATRLINREDAVVLDVREPGEYGAGHVVGAKNVPLARLESGGADLAGKRKDRPVIVYCDSGSRGSKAATALKAQGYTRVLNLSGGLAGWQQAGLPVEK